MGKYLEGFAFQSLENTEYGKYGNTKYCAKLKSGNFDKKSFEKNDGSVRCCGALTVLCPRVLCLFLFSRYVYRPRDGIVQRTTSSRWEGGSLLRCHCWTIDTYCCAAVVQGCGWLDRFVPPVMCCWGTIDTFCCIAVVQGRGWVDRFVPAECCWGVWHVSDTWKCGSLSYIFTHPPEDKRVKCVPTGSNFVGCFICFFFSCSTGPALAYRSSALPLSNVITLFSAEAILFRVYYSSGRKHVLRQATHLLYQCLVI